MSTPQSIIKICSGVRLTNRYDHTIYFDSQEAQKAYFESKVVKTFSHYTYIRKSWTIKVNDTIDNAIKWSYLFFKNKYDGKTYYYFITDVEYINDSTVELTLEIDVMQTYAFDYTMLQCYVDREHIEVDEVGASLVDEGLDPGEYVTYKDTTVDLNDLVVVIQSTANLVMVDILSDDADKDDIETAYSPIFYSAPGGVYGKCAYYCVEPADYNKLGALFNKIDSHGKSDVILNIFMYPKNLIEYSGDYTPKTLAKNITFEHSMTVSPLLYNGYAPKNKKLLQYPFNLYTVSNHSGNTAILRPELFGNPLNPYFKIVGSCNPDGAVKCYPINYKGKQHNWDEGVTLGNFPMCAWISDPYKLWVAQNQGQQVMTTIGSVGAIVGGVALIASGAGAMAGAGMIAGGVTGIAGQLAQHRDRDVQPPQSKGQHNPSLNAVHKWQTFNIQQKTVTPEYAKIIDNYFSMYGYKCNKVKVPNINSRLQYNYTKTVGSNVVGDIPQRDLVKINEIFDRGVTFWKNGDQIGNYSLLNT